MVSEEQLGTGYLVGVGFGLSGALTSGLPVPAGHGWLSGTNALLVFFGLVVLSGFTVTVIGFSKSDLAAGRIWRVAQWSTVGLGIPTLLIVSLALLDRQALAGMGWQSVATIDIAGGGLLGILFGTFVELRAEHDRTRALNQRNTVFLRLLRHDIRNSATAIQGHAEHLAASEPSLTQSIQAIRTQIDHVVRLSDAARQLDDLQTTEARASVDLPALVRDRLAVVRERYPDAEFEADLPPHGYVRANDLLSSVVDNLLVNAVEHNDDRPRVEVSVDRPDSEEVVVLRVRDDGPGFPEDELAVRSREGETPLRHSRGVGLWLVQWIVDSCDGEFAVENADGGAVATVKLPAARPDAGSAE